MTISYGEITQCCAGQQITQRWSDTAGNWERKMMPILETLYMQRLRQSQEKTDPFMALAASMTVEDDPAVCSERKRAGSGAYSHISAEKEEN